MRKYLLLVTCLLVLIAPALYAEEASEMDRLLSMLRTQKKEVIEKNLDLTEKEKKEFWPLYEEYNNKIGAIDERNVKLVGKYVAAFESMSEKQANALLEDLLDSEKENTKLKRSYVRKFRKVLPPKKVVEYFYLESKLDSIRKIEVYAALPLVY